MQIKTSVNMGETIEVSALVTATDITANPITYKLENQPKDDGTIPTGDLVTVEQDGKTFKITGVKSGTVHLIVTQNVNGVMKTATCVIYVTTPVNEVSINPSSIRLTEVQPERSSCYLIRQDQPMIKYYGLLQIQALQQLKVTATRQLSRV